MATCGCPKRAPEADPKAWPCPCGDHCPDHFSVTGLLQRVRDDHYGSLDQRELASLASHPTARLMPILVRAGGCRFTAPAQNVQHITDALEAAGDYVRDCSILPETDIHAWGL